MKNIGERLLLYNYYNSHHHYHYHVFHYHCTMHLYRLRILLIIPLDYYMIPCLFQLISFSFFRHIFFSSLTPSSELVYDHQTNFRCSLYTYIYIYSYLHFLIYTYLFILMCCLYYYMKLIKLLIKYGKYRNHNEFSRLKSVSSIEDNYSFTFLICSIAI